MKSIAYHRVSSKEQEREGFSIPSQRKLLQEYALTKGFTIAEEFTDVETAKTAGRLQFGQMIEYLKKHKEIKIVLVEKTDRLYRNIKDWVILDEFDLEFHFVKENFILSRESISNDKLIHGIKVLMAKNYVDNLSEEVHKGLLEKAAQGKWPHRAPVGYVNNKLTHTIEPDSEKGELIKRLFIEYSSGEKALDQLAAMAKASGLFSRNSQAINKAGIHRILTNPIYYGEFIWKGKKYAGEHAPLISRKLFDDVQSILTGSSGTTRKTRKFPFSGLVKCGICGCSMTAEVKKRKYVYYHCTQFRGKCGNTYIREESLDQLFAEVVGRIKVDHSTVSDIKRALIESQKDRLKHQKESLKALRRRQDHLRRMLDNAYEDKLIGSIAEDLWIRKSREWQGELDQATSRLAELESASMNYYDTGVRILELANSAYGRYLKQSGEEKTRLLNSLLSNSTFTRGTLFPTYNKPFDILAKGADFESMRALRDEFLKSMNSTEVIEGHEVYRFQQVI
ncbi:recombinase family protein [bacterium AH-315-J21]|nr:recombinase family protein [bacterium AH-315-J21]